MYYIAICDNDKKNITYIEDMINELANKDNVKIKFYEFCSGEQLINSINNVIQYDLLILDTNLSGMDGYEVARIFRRSYPDVVLVFCSSVHMPIIKLFKVRPYRYLLKSNSNSEFKQDMKEIWEEVKNKANDSFIIGHYRNNLFKIKIRDILYIENAKRGSKVIVNEKSSNNICDTILVDDKIHEISKKYPQLIFAHNSYIVNINNVVSIYGPELIFDNGEKLSISRTYYKTFRTIFEENLYIN